MLNRRLVRALFGATALAAAALPAPAAAQRIGRIIAFGDSYPDTGIARTTIINDPAASPSFRALVTQFYPTGRFSGGTNYIDTLSNILNAPVENFAVGGALATTFPNGASNTNCSPPGGPGSPAICPLGFASQVNQFLDVGAQNPLFPTASMFDSSDLVTVSIGGNDARYYQQFFSASPMTPFVAASIAGATTQLDRLVAAGAPTISFLAGDTSRLSEVVANPSAQAIRSAYSTAFNTGIQGPLAGYAADGVMVHYLDLNLVFDNVLASPTAYGITQGSAASLYTCPPPTPTNPGCLGNASGYLFYFDGLHLTSDGFAIVARYVAAQLQAPLTFVSTSELALDTAQQFGRMLSSRMDFTGGNEQGLRFFVVGDTFSNEVVESDTSEAFDVSSVGATAGATYAFGNAQAGAAVNYSRPKARFGRDASETRSKTLQMGGFAGFDMGGAFAQGYAGYGKDDHDIDRRGVVENMNASPDGSHWIAGAKAGYLLSSGNFRFGPVAGLDYAKAKVDAYTEEGDPALTLNVGSVSAKSLIGSVGAELQGKIEAAGMAVRPLFGIALEKELSGGDRTVRFAQTLAPGIVNRWEVGSGSKSAYGRLTGGFGAAILGGVELDAQASLTLGRDQGEETSAHVGLRFGF